MPKARDAPLEPTSYSDPEENMPAFIRYPFFGCVILALSACGSSGSSRLLEPAAPPMPDDSEPVSTVQEAYSSVDYLITDISAAINKLPTKEVYKDADGNKYLLTSANVTDMNLDDVVLPTGVMPAPDFADLRAVYRDAAGNEYLLTPANVADMDLMGVDLPDGVTDAPDFASLTKVREGTTALRSTPAALNTLRNSIISASSRYLSMGTILARTDNDDERPNYDSMGNPDSAVSPNPTATCEDRSATGPAKCVFGMDSLREEETTFHLGLGSATDENRVSFRSFMADREPVMIYRQTLMSQVRTIPPQDADRREVYVDAMEREYLLTSENITNMELTDETGLPMGVALDAAPSFTDLFAVYEDDDDNRYLLTPDNVMNMELTDETGLPTGVTLDTAPDFASLSKVREDPEGGREEYVGYDGMLRYSMFFVGVHRFFDEEDELTAVRFEHASLGRIYDEDAIESGIQSPSVELTGEGVMVGMERRTSTLESHLVQGDVNIMYDPAVAADDSVVPAILAMDAMVDISITNIQRLADDGDAWYADPARQARLSWTDLEVTDSKFSHIPRDSSPLTLDQGRLSGSFYGTEADPEVGGVFHHDDGLYEIIGSFGSKLDPVPDDDEDMMDPMQ